MVGIFVIGLLFLIVRLFIRSATAIDSPNRLDSVRNCHIVVIANKYQHRKYLRVNAYDRGVPLPFISYGGSSYFILSFAFGICLKLERGREANEVLQTT